MLLRLYQSFIRPYLFLVAFCVLTYITELSLTHFEKFRFYNLLENIAASCLSYFLFVFLFKVIFNKSIKLLIYGLIVLVLMLEGLYYLVFDAEFSASAIYITLDTNPSEVREFFSYNHSWEMLIYFLTLLLGSFVCWKWLRFPILNKIGSVSIFWGVKALMVMVLFLFLSHPLIRIQNFPYIFFSGIYEYWTQSKLLNDQKNNKFGDFEAVSFHGTDDPSTLVVVIGESTSRAHFGLYGYRPNTTPMLSDIRNELVLYDDVISGHTYTIESIKSALSVADENEYHGNILQLLNAAGYKTFWLSNQPPIGLFETLITKIALTAQESMFLTTENFLYHSPYDEVLLKPFHKVLLDPAPKKAIFVHLMGAHGNYGHRYPKTFRKIPVETKSEIDRMRAHYDNAIFYNDSIVSQLIGLTKQSAPNSALIYFSDHGEEVYDHIDFAGHTPDQILTPNMVEIPFILWQSERMKSTSTKIIDPHRKFILNDLLHSLADWFDVSAAQIDTTKSLFHKSYRPKPRIILDSIDFDIFQQSGQKVLKLK